MYHSKVSPRREGKSLMTNQLRCGHWEGEEFPTCSACSAQKIIDVGREKWSTRVHRWRTQKRNLYEFSFLLPLDVQTTLSSSNNLTRSQTPATTTTTVMTVTIVTTVTTPTTRATVTCPLTAASRLTAIKSRRSTIARCTSSSRT